VAGRARSQRVREERGTGNDKPTYNADGARLPVGSLMPISPPSFVDATEISMRAFVSMWIVAQTGAKRNVLLWWAGVCSLGQVRPGIVVAIS
jgi:hypothetical protein